MGIFQHCVISGRVQCAVAREQHPDRDRASHIGQTLVANPELEVQEVAQVRCVLHQIVAGLCIEVRDHQIR